MKNCAFNKAKFVTTAVNKGGYPELKGPSGELLPEIAVFGRSNVGKSSLLNHLFHQKQLVKTSSTPGKTQALNFFAVDDKLVFVDLPGYGFAQVAQEVRKQWGPMVKEYLQLRLQLQVILFLFDVRRLPNEDDKQFMELFAQEQKQIILVLTKVDKLNLGELKKQSRAIISAFAKENLAVIHFSAHKNLGAKELTHQIFTALTANGDH